VHTYPQWEEKTIDAALPYSIENLTAVRAALPDKRSWSSRPLGDGRDRVRRARQRGRPGAAFPRVAGMGAANNTAVFWFEAFDEPWKGHSDEPLAAEKHWGLFDVKRRPKLAMQ